MGPAEAIKTCLARYLQFNGREARPATVLLVAAIALSATITQAQTNTNEVNETLTICLDETLDFHERRSAVEAISWKPAVTDAESNAFWALQMGMSYRGGALVLRDNHFRGLMSNDGTQFALGILQMRISDGLIATCTISSTTNIDFEELSLIFGGDILDGDDFRALEWPTNSLTHDQISSDAVPFSAVVRLQTLVNLPTQRQ